MGPDFEDLLERLDQMIADEMQDELRRAHAARDFYVTMDYGVPEPNPLFIYLDPRSGRRGEHSARLPYDVEGTAEEIIPELEP